MLAAALALTLLSSSSPPIILPRDGGPNSPPIDAVVLFDGTNLDRWTKLDGTPPGWERTPPVTAGDEQAPGFMTVAPGTGSLIATEKMEDCQVHIEFATPTDDAEQNKAGQERGNSGVYLHARYEVQVLDSYKSETYPDGQCGAIYGEHPPLVNACRKPGEWQTYDIIFRAPRFDEKGKKTANAVLTVLHNGVLIHDHAEVTKPTAAAGEQDDTPPGPAPVLMLQDHGNRVRYRNIWARPLEPREFPR